MASTNNTEGAISPLTSDLDPELHLTLIVLSTIAFLVSFIAVATKFIFVYVIPVAWKCCIMSQDVSALFLSLGLVLVSAFIGGASEAACKAGGFFMLFGLMDTAFNLVLLSITLIFIQNPSKMSQLSTFRYSLFLSIVVPQKLIMTLLVALPVTPIHYFDDLIELYPLTCFPVRQEGRKGATFGAILFFILWTILVVAIFLAVSSTFKFLKEPSTKIHASSPSLWQVQKMEQGKTLHKHSLFEVGLTVVLTLIVTLIVYTNSGFLRAPQWAALISMAIAACLRGVLSIVQFIMWSTICCNQSAQKKEPYHRLKQLELIKNEGPGKLRMRASWMAGRGMWKRGLLKVYGPAHIKAWAQEIVVLGLLRKSRSASVLQCLWTSNCNPYYETMTLISGDIVTSDSRLTCLELTSSGTLQDLLKTMDVPLPEPCQKTIMHDIAEGLSYLHDQNVLHGNITSSAVYLKGSVQCLVLRAAVGDFEEAQIFGTLLTGSPSSNISRKTFFFPDIRAYALVGIEMLSRICECRQREKQPYRRTAIKVTPGLKANNIQLACQEDHSHHPHRYRNHQHHQYHHHNHNSSISVAASGSDKTDGIDHRGVIRYESQEVPYSVPGEAEYNPRGKSFARKGKIVNPMPSPTRNKFTSESTTRPLSPILDVNGYAQQLDQNWMLQSIPKTVPRSCRQDDESNSLCDEYVACDNDRFNHKQAPGVTYSNEVHNFEFPNHSVFKTASGDLNEDLDMIEEEIERNTSALQGVKNKKYKQGGYITSKTEDGREIFLPAALKAKSSGANSSSGYGSASDIYNPGGNTTPRQQSSVMQVHKTTSSATISSFEDDGLEVLPGMTDMHEKVSKGDRMLKELMKSKQDAKVEMLIESYEERVKRGELRNTLEGLPIGVVFPKKNRKGSVTVTQESGNSVDQIEPSLEMYDALDNRKEIRGGGDTKLNSPRPKSAMRAMNDHFQRRSSRPLSASNSTFSAWNARSSLKRNKARHALKKVLSGKGARDIQWVRPDMERGTRGKEVEMKYTGRLGSSTATGNITLQNHTPVKGELSGDVTLTLLKERESVNGPLTSPAGSTASPRRHPDKIAHVSPTLVKPAGASVTRIPSQKTKPAPPPPTSPPRKSDPSSQSSDVYTYDKPKPEEKQHIPPQNTNESSTSANPESSVSDSIDNTESTEQSDHVMNIAAQIETDMNNIIQGTVVNGIPLPGGIRLLDSGFDSASVSSEESCICAAAALQAVEEGYSCPSEAFSQGACSCACSNCIQESHMYPKGSSWTGSQDSESWSNSNSLSSYDTNMHRRKISTRRRESPGLVLAPDEQYPSPGRRNRQSGISNNLHPRYPYSPKRNRRSLGHTKGNYPSSSSETSSAASKRYRELIKKGVPLRVSVVTGDDGIIGEDKSPSHAQLISDQSVNSAGVKKDNSLYTNLEHGGFFETDPAKQKHYQNIHPIPYHSSHSHDDFDEDDEDHYCQLSPIPSLEEIIKEIPDETGHYSEEARAFLNRPESDMSIKALQAVLSRHGSTMEGRHIQDAELIIDRIFSQQPGSSSNVTPGMSLHTGLELDDASIREIARLPNKHSDPNDVSDIAGLLPGMDARHIRYCHSISSRVHLVNLNELLPASAQTFDQLKMKLQISGGIGNIGNQLLDLIRMCWLNEVPPSTAAIVDLLTDHITETEL